MAADQLSVTFAALADPTRRAILARLTDTDARVTDIAAQFPISLNSISKHIRMLERAGLVRREISGRDHVLSLRGEGLAEAVAWMQRYREFWEQRLAALEAFVLQDDAADGSLPQDDEVPRSERDRAAEPDGGPR